ncbi:MAG TPA: antitoxin family protein [Thermoanaerobaculia bacterium]|nr:antitoxin family protein [Thermoanaerobaculia bacterium]
MTDTRIGNQSRAGAIRLFDAVYEDGVLKPLQDPGLPENHHFLVQVQELGEKKSAAELAEWHRVYEDLSEEDVTEVESVALDRNQFSRRVPGEPLDLQELNDLDTWSRDMDVLAAAIPPEDFIRLEAALAEADQVDAAEPQVNAADIKTWSREIAAAADRIPEEEHQRFLAALATKKNLRSRIDRSRHPRRRRRTRLER